jgi:hypothetical protein
LDGTAVRQAQAKGATREAAGSAGQAKQNQANLLGSFGLIRPVQASSTGCGESK